MCILQSNLFYSWVNVSGVLLNFTCTEQSNYLHSVQLEQVKGRHEVLSTRQQDSTLTWTSSQFSYEGASLQEVDNPFKSTDKAPRQHISPPACLIG